MSLKETKNKVNLYRFTFYTHTPLRLPVLPVFIVSKGYDSSKARAIRLSSHMMFQRAKLEGLIDL